MRYAGNKDKKVYNAIIQSYIDAHGITKVVDVFGGSGGASLRLNVAKKHYNELNVEMYRIVRWLATECQPDDLRGIAAEWGEDAVYSGRREGDKRGGNRLHVVKDYYYMRRAEYIANPENTQLLYALVRYCFGGFGPTSLTAGGYCDLRQDIKKLPYYRQFTALTNLCYSALDYTDDPTTLYIFDPPYITDKMKIEYTKGFDPHAFWAWLESSTMPHIIAFDTADHHGLTLHAELSKTWTAAGKSQQNKATERIYTR